MIASTLSDRMKEYESVSQTKLIKKLPVIIRLDGRGFSKFTRGFEKPFDKELSTIFQNVALGLRKTIGNVKFIYSQSDEISLLLTDWDSNKQEDGGRIDAWYDYRVQKIISTISAEATALFNKELYNLMQVYENLSNEDSIKIVDNGLVVVNKDMCKERYKLLKRKLFTAQFDARIFNLPLDEVTNYFIFRQQDALRNSVSGFARKYYSTKQLQGVNNTTKIEMVRKDYGIDFNTDISQLQKVGFAIITNFKAKDTDKDKFELDTNIPLFKEDREYIERYL